MSERIKLPPSLDANSAIEDLTFIFNQAKDRISVLTGDAEKLYQRSVVLLTVSITVLTSIIAYIGTNFEWNFTTLLLGTIAVVLWIVCTILKPNLIPSDYQDIGSEPVSLAVDAVYTELQGRPPEWYLLYSEIINYQQRIDKNKITNDFRADNLKDAITWLFRIPSLSLAILVISKIFGLI
jgi:hypothetical protein